ncbi:MAG: peptidylprolyl isomerase [Methanobrevibacter sp.]|jgi:peptidylprolyl isomerase/FKBP-type peptidyl-prolyl cis-trans isomerase SlyD|nr:peptidylprolyl isomerase [Methanobrevibacter sp.]
MVIKNGDFIRLDLISKTKETGEVFETTYEEVAKETGIYDENKAYVPMPVIVSGNHLLPPLDEALIGLGEGESKHVEILPDEVFGERNPALIKMIPLKEFKKQNINPVPGAIISTGDGKGKVLTVSSGRVKVDFNHPLAGKALEYDLVVKEIIGDIEDKIKAMIQLHYDHPIYDVNKTKIKVDGKIATIELDEITKYDNEKSQLNITSFKHRISKDIWENLDIDEVDFVDVFKKPPEKDPEEESSTDEQKDSKESSSDDEVVEADYEVKK